MTRKGKVDEALAGETEKVLKQINELYESGLSAGAPGALGLKALADSVGMKLQKPRKKVSVLLVGNHSAGKSSFINWYTGDSIQKTGVAIETRGFTFVTSGKKRDTLTGEATLRFYDHLQGFEKFEGIIPNLFTEISASKDKNFSTVDFIDTPGLVDGDMQYPFNVQDAIVWMADHVDLVLIFLDPMGQATCKRTMEVVERLNNSQNLEKIRYYMSKADTVELEQDRTRVCIQITQNLTSRIRNAHAFNLPTFYLPRDDDVPCTIPNAINELCQDIDKTIQMTVQKQLRTLREDCGRIDKCIEMKLQDDKAAKSRNLKRKLQGSGLALATLSTAGLVALLALINVLEPLCSSFKGLKHTCESTDLVQGLRKLRASVAEHFGTYIGAAGALTLVFLITTLLVWRTVPVLTKRDIRKLEEYRVYVSKVAEQESALWSEYFRTIRGKEQ